MKFFLMSQILEQVFWSYINKSNNENNLVKESSCLKNLKT